VSGPSQPSSGAGDFKARVLAAVNVVELIGQTVSLKRRGKDYVGLCPFHQEKTPSFHVNPTKQYFICFGCKASGNAIDFVMKRDRMEFIDALRNLGQSVGLEMPRRGGGQNEKPGERQQLLDACSAACALFEKLLSDPQVGLAARNYLEQRGFEAEAIKRFQVGFAPEAWDTLVRSPVARKYPPTILSLAGLIKPRNTGDGYYDTFRNRVIFPIRDENGRVIAFGGRVMPGSEDPAKYLNSPETPLFSKSRSIFGLDLARQRIVETRTVAVVEGYTDVMMAHQFGVTNVVATLGTAMTEQHVNILRRFADRIVLLFDADEAGETAVNRAVELFMSQPVDFAVATMPDETDPDEFLIQQGTEAFQKLLDDAPSVLMYLLKQFKRRWTENDQNIPEQQKAQEAFIAPFLQAKNEAAINPDRWHSVLAELGRLIGVSFEALQRRYGTAKSQRKTSQAAMTSEPNNTAPVARKMPTAQDLAECHILGALLMEPARWHDMQQVVDPADFTDEKRRQLAEVYWHHQRDEGEPVFNQFLSDLPDTGLVELAVELVVECEKLPALNDAVRDAVLHLDGVRQRRKEQKLVAQFGRKDQKLGEEEEITALKELVESVSRPNLRRSGA
jgi:DNA primase